MPAKQPPRYQIRNDLASRRGRHVLIYTVWDSVLRRQVAGPYDSLREAQEAAAGLWQAYLFTHSTLESLRREREARDQ